jgi:hypothetical protein
MELDADTYVFVAESVGYHKSLAFLLVIASSYNVNYCH